MASQDAPASYLCNHLRAGLIAAPIIHVTIIAMTFDPVLLFTSAVGGGLDFLFTTFEAISLPFVSVVLYPLQSIIAYFSSIFASGTIA